MPAARVNQYERAFRAWPLLTATAAKRSTISAWSWPGTCTSILGRFATYWLPPKTDAGQAPRSRDGSRRAHSGRLCGTAVSQLEA
jgi:hypothetical protein